MCEKGTVWCQKDVFAGGRGAVSTKKASSLGKGALRYQKGASGGRGAVSAYKGAVMGEKGHFKCQKGSFAVGRGVVST